MEQRKRPGGEQGLGYYTSWEKSKGNGCIYCGKPATTRVVLCQEKVQIKYALFSVKLPC